MNQRQNQLVLNNLGLAYDFAEAYRWHPKHTDIVQACLLGLCEAALRWDSKGKAKFSTYAYYWMRNCSGTELKQPEPIAAPEAPDLLKSGDYEEFIAEIFYIPGVRDLLLRLIRKLPENERHAILLKYPLDPESRTYTDVLIAKMLDCSETWVGKLRKKAFDRLREELFKEGVR